MDEHEIERMVDEEIARRRAAGALASKSTPSVWSTLSHHPLALLIFGFIVTTVIGGGYDQILKERAEDRTRAAHMIEKARSDKEEAIHRLHSYVSLNFDRTVLGERLRFALKDGDGALAQEFRREYDEVYRKSRVELAQDLLMLRSLIGVPDKKSFYETAVQRSIDPALARQATCLFFLYDRARLSGFNALPLALDAASWQCQTKAGERWWDKLKEVETTARICSHAILSNMLGQIDDRADRLMEFWSQPHQERRDPELILDPDWSDRIEAALNKECPRYES